MKHTIIIITALAMARVFGAGREACHNERESTANALARIEAASFELPGDSAWAHDRVAEANASLFDSSHLSEPLTAFAGGFRDNTLDEALAFFAPEVPVGMRFEYKTFASAEEFGNDSDDERPIGADFKNVDEKGTVVTGKLANRGLQICIDEDEVNDDPNWRERKVGRLLRRLQRNALIRAVALLEAAATNTAKTWDTTAGKDPDNDVLTDLSDAGDSSGIDPNRVAYGRTAWLKRQLATRAQSAASGFGSAPMNEAELAAFLGVDQVLRTKSRYGTGATKTRLLAAKVLSFTAYDNPDPMGDASNIKRFYRLLDGQRYRVYEWRDGPKKYRIVVEHYELTKITSTLGIRTLTIS